MCHVGLLWLRLEIERAVPTCWWTMLASWPAGWLSISQATGASAAAPALADSAPQEASLPLKLVGATRTQRAFSLRLRGGGDELHGAASYNNLLGAGDREDPDPAEDDECVICLEPLHPWAVAACGHRRHLLCMLLWLDCCQCNAYLGAGA